MKLNQFGVMISLGFDGGGDVCHFDKKDMLNEGIGHIFQ